MALDVENFVNVLKKYNFDTFYGVPDSLLKNFCAYIKDNFDKSHNIITANEGNAIAMACGHYLATSNIAVCYMQNSGLGNSVNPLVSLSDVDVYNIPVFLIIGLRGEVGVHDEPQHVKQGKITTSLLDCLEIKYQVIDENADNIDLLISSAYEYMTTTKRPYALVVKKNTFANYTLQNKTQNLSKLTREEAIDTICDSLDVDSVIVSSTGFISRELYLNREKEKKSHASDFLTVGSMGHASSIALAIALSKKEKIIYCFDGDGALLMHMGALGVIGSLCPDNFKHIVFNNAAHDSVGAQPTVAGGIDICQLALSCNYKKAYSVSSKEELKAVLPKFIEDKGCFLLEVKVSCGVRADLLRPKESPKVNKKIFMEMLQN